MKILKRDSLQEGGFAGLKEHRLVKAPGVFGANENNDGSWPGLGNFVYLADARFTPHGETRMHSHHEIDVISVMVDGRISHEGSMAHGQDLTSNDVQVQRAGGEGFSHNEINPDNDWNRMIQLWASPEVAGMAAAYKVYSPVLGETTRIYGGDSSADFSAGTTIDIARLESGQQIDINGAYLIYITRGTGTVNTEQVEDGDLIRGESARFEASSDVQLIIIQAEGE